MKDTIVAVSHLIVDVTFGVQQTGNRSFRVWSKKGNGARIMSCSYDTYEEASQEAIKMAKDSAIYPDKLEVM